MRYWMLPVVLGAMVVGMLTPVHAQLNSLPVIVSPKGGTGFTLAADYGRGLNAESGKNTAVGVQGSLGFGAFSAGVGLGIVNPQVPPGDRETEFQYMGTAALRIFGGPLVPVAVNIHGGVGVLSTDVSATQDRREIKIPVGVGIALNIPATAFSFEPWVAPRYTIVRVSQSGASDSQSGFGLSAGIALGFANGLGIRAAVDWVDLDAATLIAPADIPGIQPAVFGVGLSYTFRLPSLVGAQ